MSSVADEAKEALLRAHLEAHYGCTVARIQRLDRGVFDIRLRDGRRWVARVFERRPLDQVELDAALLRFLEREIFPAERCADASPVSTLYGRAILITEHIEGVPAGAGEATLRTLGDRLGRLATLAGDDGAVMRPSGALHHYVPGGGGPHEELAAAVSWLDAIRERVPAQSRTLYESLRQLLAQTDTCADLPAALIHPDPVLKNVLAGNNGDLVLIDWTGAGRGPRLFSLAVGIWSCALAKCNWSATRVDALAEGYRAHVRLEPEELRRLQRVMRIRPLVFACWRFRHAVRAGNVPDGSEWWWPSEPLVEKIAACACRALQR